MKSQCDEQQPKAKLQGDWIIYKQLRIRYSSIDAIFIDSDCLLINGLRQQFQHSEIEAILEAIDNEE